MTYVISHIFDTSQHKQNELMRWKEVTKSTHVPDKRPDDEEARKVWSKELAQWVTKQRARKDGLDPLRRKKLDDIDFIWSKYDADWEERFNELKRWKEVMKTTDVPQGKPRDKKARKVWSPELATWVRNQRSSQGPKKNSEHREKLDEIGFIWSKRDADWEERFIELMRWKDAMKNTDVPQKKPSDEEARKVWSKELANWVGNQRKRKAGLNPLRQEKLDRIDFF